MPQQTRTELSPFLLATDLDGTFAGGSSAEQRLLQEALRLSPEIRLIYVTGREIPATRELIESLPLPHPDLLISDVGTRVSRGSDLSAIPELEAPIAALWPGRPAVLEALAGMPGIREQDVRSPNRVSYWRAGAPMDAVLAEMATRLHRLPVELVGSADMYIDVLPLGVNKGTTLLRVLDWLGLPPTEVVVAGDTLNDLALFETGLRGVVVGGCEPGLRERLQGRKQVYFAEAVGAGGVHEGLAHFGCLPAARGVRDAE